MLSMLMLMSLSRSSDDDLRGWLDARPEPRPPPLPPPPPPFAVVVVVVAVVAVAVVAVDAAAAECFLLDEDDIFCVDFARNRFFFCGAARHRP